MEELVGKCTSCQKEVYCKDGFLDGVALEQGGVVCFACHEKSELINLLNTLLEAEKAGAKTMALLLETHPGDALLQQVKDDESWSCQGLIRSVQREGGKVSTATGDFAEKVMALPTFSERLTLLIKGQAWVVKRIDKALALPMAQETKEFLEEMKKKHVDNIYEVEQIV